MPTCRSFSCPTKCNGYWSGCRNYGCVDYAPGAITHSIADSDGVCVHNVTRMCTNVTDWNHWQEVAGVSNGSYYTGTLPNPGATYRSYREATSGSEADAGEESINRHVEDLRYAINEERRRRDKAGATSIGTKTWTEKGSGTGQDIGDMNGVLIDNQIIQEMVSAVNDIKANHITDVDPQDNTLIDAYHIDRIRKQIENLRKNCISNKVCSPNTVCSCFCHCNCHYSDRRLKENIRSL